MDGPTRHQPDHKDIDARRQRTYLLSRMQRTCSISMGICTLYVIALIFWIMQGPNHAFRNASGQAILLASGLAVIGWSMWTSLRCQATRAKAKKAGWRLCPVCLYALSPGGTDAEDALFCPECGGRYEMSDLKAAWLARKG